MTVVLDDAPAAYVLRIDGRDVGSAFFTERSGTIVFTHTAVDPPFAGRLLGIRLAAAALDDACARRG